MRKKKFPSRLIAVVSVVLVVGVAFWVVRTWGPGASKTRVRSASSRPWRRPIEPRPLPPKPKTDVVRPETGPEGRTPVLSSMAIILDDWGMSEALLPKAIALNRPITLSVLPHLPHSESVARQAAQNGLGVMLHMPMEPKSRMAPKETEVIRVGASEATIRRYLDAALESVPGARGVNNHQGSAATSDARVMKIVLEHLHGKNLFFVDSVVIATTAGPSAAEATGIPFTRRDVFIDNVAEKAAIEKELRKAIQMAVRRKRVVVIGHDKRATLEAIAAMIPEIERAGVRLVLVEDLVR